MAEEYKSEFTFELIKPLPYHRDGEQVFAKEIILKAPSNKQQHETSKLKQGFHRAIHELQNSEAANSKKNKNKDNEEDINGEDIISMIMASKIDFGEYQQVFGSLLRNDIGWIENEKITMPIYNNISDEDFEKMMGEYIANFLLISMMKNFKKK